MFFQFSWTFFGTHPKIEDIFEKLIDFSLLYPLRMSLKHFSRQRKLRYQFFRNQENCKVLKLHKNSLCRQDIHNWHDLEYQFALENFWSDFEIWLTRQIFLLIVLDVYVAKAWYTVASVVRFALVCFRPTWTRCLDKQLQ